MAQKEEDAPPLEPAASDAAARSALVRINVFAWAEYAALFSYATWAAVTAVRDGHHAALAIWAYVTTTQTGAPAYSQPSAVVLAYIVGLAGLAAIFGIALCIKTANLLNLGVTASSFVETAFSLLLHPFVAYGYAQDFDTHIHHVRWMGGFAMSSLLFVLLLPYLNIATLGTLIGTAICMAAGIAFLIAQEADVVQAAHRDADHPQLEKANENRTDIAAPSRFHYNHGWMWFTVGCGVLGLTAPLVAAYVPFVYATDIYTETDHALRSAFLALFWTLPCYLLLQIAFYIACLATPFRRPLLKESLWANVLNPAACAILCVYLVRLNAAGAATDLHATLVTMT